MIKLHFETRIHTEPLSAFQHQIYENHQFMLAVFAHNAAALAVSERWTSCQQMVGNPAYTTVAIEQICQLFIEDYQAAQRLCRPDSRLKSDEQIIESVGIFWLDQQGKGYVYQAGKCLFTILKKMGFPIPVNGLGTIREICLEDGDRLVLDLKRGDIANNLNQTIGGLSAEEDLEAHFGRYNYPFSLTSVKRENQNVQSLQTGTVYSDTREKYKLISHEEDIRREHSKQMTEARQKVSESKRSTARFKQLWIILLLLVSTAFIFFLLKKPGMQNFTGKLEPAMTADKISSDSSQSLSLQDHRLEQKIKNKRLRPLLDSAQYAFRKANAHLQNGKNKHALIELDSAEQRFERYLLLRPGGQADIVPLLNEIRHKRRLIMGEVAF